MYLKLKRSRCIETCVPQYRVLGVSEGTIQTTVVAVLQAMFLHISVTFVLAGA